MDPGALEHGRTGRDARPVREDRLPRLSGVRGEAVMTYSAWRLVLAVVWYPRYRILLCADTCLPPSPWTAVFRVEVDHGHRVIRLSGDLT